MIDIEQLEMICEKLYHDIESMYSVESSILKNIDALYELDNTNPFTDRVRKDVQNTIEDLTLLHKFIKNYIKDMRCAAPPLVVHQDISQLISNTVFQFCKDNNLHYRLLNAPVKVVLNEKDNKYYEPDIIVVFDNEKIKRDGCYGAPDIIFEIVSRSTRKVDYEEKRNVYLKNGVKEYFIVDPIKRSTVLCNDKIGITEKKFNEDFMIESIPGLIINIHNLLLSYLL